MSCLCVEGLSRFFGFIGDSYLCGNVQCVN